MTFQTKTPVALCLFVRYETAKRVFEVIRQVKPPVLLVSANAPRPDRPGEAERCAAARSIIDGVDWKCEVLMKYAETHLDVGQSLSGAYRWVFNTVEEAIVLEDDFLPHPTFFRFCDELLERYRYDTRIFSINANNYQLGRKRTDYSYYFSRYTHTFGWASWRRVWKDYDYDMKLWPEIRASNFLQDILTKPDAVKYWTKTLDETQDRLLISWDYPWLLTCWMQNGLNITPNVNLVANIGFDADSINFQKKLTKFDDVPVEPMEFPLKHPPYIIRDNQADEFTQKYYFQGGVWRQFKDEAKRILGR